MFAVPDGIVELFALIIYSFNSTKLITAFTVTLDADDALIVKVSSGSK